METNRHHLFYPRRRYTSKPERALRNHPGLVVPTWVPAHRLLHIEAGTPPKPGAELSRAIINNLEEHTLSDRLDGLFYTVEFLMDREGKTEQHLTTHLTKQLGYLQMRGVEHGVGEIHR